MHLPHSYNGGQLGVLVVVILPLLGGSMWFYNAYRLGRLKWKPKKPANARVVTAVILIFISGHFSIAISA